MPSLAGNKMTLESNRFQSVLIVFAAITQTVFSLYEFDVSPDIVLLEQHTDRIRGITQNEGVDFILGGLFPVHTSSGSGCGEIRLEKGLERLEAMLFAIDLINNDTELLPGLRLGYDIRDSCNTENVALDESIHLISSGDLLDVESCAGEAPLTTSTLNTTERVSTSAVIGAASSFVSIPVASLLRLFNIPQVSYASSSPVLSNRDRYGYFYRTVPADDLQARAMIDLALRFEWRYFSTIYSDNPYGEPGIDELRRLAQENGLCIDVDEGIGESFTAVDYRRVALQILNSSAEVVILFASQDHAKELFVQLDNIQQEFGSSRQFLWIASDSWVQSITLVHQFNRTVAGLWGITPLSHFIQAFQEYFSQLTPISDLRDPWFEEFYKAYLGCNEDNNSCSNNSRITDQPKYAQGAKVAQVIDAVYSVAHAVHNFLTDNCDDPITWHRQNQSCNGQVQPLNGETVLGYLQNVSFFNNVTNNTIVFDSNGNVEARYKVLNYQQMTTPNGNVEYEFVTVGVWDGTAEPGMRLSLTKSFPFQFGLSESGQVLHSRESHCQLCQPGYYHRQILSSCCGTCDPCLGMSYSNSSTSFECLLCPKFTWGNNPLVGSNTCIPIQESFLQYHDIWAIALVVFAAIGILSIGFVSVLMGVFWDTPVIKSSGREQMVLILIGITCCFILTFFYIGRPSTFTCVFQRVGVWFCFSIILGAILIKLIRIARIFLRGKGTTRPKFITPSYQVLFTFFVVGGQLLLSVISLITVYPSAELVVTNASNSNDFPFTLVKCASPDIVTFILHLVYLSALVIANNVLALLTIRFPSNFKEAMHISFSTFAIGLIWIVFIPTYFATTNKFRIAVISSAAQLTGLAVLFCLFGPRLYLTVVHLKGQTKPATSDKVLSVSVSAGLPTSDSSTNKRSQPPDGIISLSSLA